jgi:hypothetical protein
MRNHNTNGLLNPNDMGAINNTPSTRIACNWSKGGGGHMSRQHDEPSEIKARLGKRIARTSPGLLGVTSQGPTRVEQ